jgi:hypothetical protein
VRRLQVEHLVERLLGKEVRAVMKHPVLVEDALAANRGCPEGLGGGGVGLCGAVGFA